MLRQPSSPSGACVEIGRGLRRGPAPATITKAG